MTPLPRLMGELEPLSSQMAESFKKFSAHHTELKMDHNDGKTKSDKLTALLATSYFVWSLLLVT